MPTILQFSSGILSVSLKPIRKRRAGESLAIHSFNLRADPYYIRNSHKQRVLCYLFSHVLACRDPRTQLTILKTVRHISDSVKLPTLFPLMKELMKNKGISGLNEADKLTFSEILFGCYDATSIPALEEPRNEYWPFFLEGLQLVNDAGLFHVRDAIHNV
jgi:hypothetical protein